MADFSIEERKTYYLTKLQSYVRTQPADGTDLAELASRVKGDMTLSELGKLCGVNKSTLSRLLNGKTQKNSTNDMIAGLAAVADSIPDCSVSFDDLIKANGMARKDNADKDQLNNIIKNCDSAIVTSLALSGISVKVLQNKSQDSFDLLLKTDSLPGVWAIQKFFILPASKSASSDLIVQQAMKKDLTCFFANIYLNGNNDFSKYSAVINNKKAYEWAIRCTSGKTIRDNVSIILMNPECTHLIEEKVITSK